MWTEGNNQEYIVVLASMSIPSATGSGDGLVPSGTKLLPEPMLTKIDDAIWRQ